MSKCGIGLAVRLAANGMFQVEDMTPNTPSQLCGFFKKGDLITAVDGNSVIGFTMDQFVDAVLGVPGSDITVAIQRKNRDDLSAAADRLSHTLQRGLPKTAKELSQMQAERERAAQVAELERRKQMSVSRPMPGIAADVGKSGFLFKRSSSKLLGNYKWQKRFFFVSGNVLYYRNLTEESGPSQFKSSNLLSGLSSDKKIVFGSNTEILNSPFDQTQFSISGAQNEQEREFVFKAANAVERQDWVDALLRCSSGEEPASPPSKQDSVSNTSDADSSSGRLPSRRASLPAIMSTSTAAQFSATVQPSHSRSDFVANFHTAEFPAARPSATHAPAPASNTVAGATVTRPAAGRLELNSKKVQVQKAIGDTEGAGSLVSKFALSAGATVAWLYDPLSVGEGAALTAQLKNHARTLTCLSYSISHSELLQPLLAALKPLSALTHINITGQVFTRGAIQLFATAIEDTRNLSHVSMCSAHLSDDILSVLLQALSSHRYVTFLKLCDNNITAEGFASVLKVLPRITGLELDVNPISTKFNSALPAIQQGLRDAANLSWLSLQQTGIAVGEVDQIIQNLMHMQSLEHLTMDATPRELFDVIIKKGNSASQFRFPPSCYVDAGWPECLWYLKHSNRFGHTTRRNVNICFFGPPSSGKTSFVNALFSSVINPASAVDVSCPTVGYRKYTVPLENPSVLAQVIDLGSQGDNVACLSPFVTNKYTLFVIVWKRPDTLDPLSEQLLLPLVSWVRAIATMAPAATFLLVATHSNTPRTGESHSSYKTAFQSMLKEVAARIKVELDRIQESYSSELTELQRSIQKLKAQLVAQEIRKRKLGSPCPGTTVLDMPGIPDDVRSCNVVISELYSRINDLSARCSRITQGLTAQGISHSVASFNMLSTLEFDSSCETDAPFAKDAFKCALSDYVLNAYWKNESCIQFQDTISDTLSKLPAHQYSFSQCVSECHILINQAADNYVANSLQMSASTSIDSDFFQSHSATVSPSRICGVQCEVQQPGGELKIFIVDCNNVTFSTLVTSKHPFVQDYLDQDPALLVPFIQGTTGLGGSPSMHQVDVTFANGSWTVAVVRPLKLKFNLSMERSPNARAPPTKLTVKDVGNVIKALVSFDAVCMVGQIIFPATKVFESLFSLLVHPQPRRMAVASIDLNSSDADFKALEDVGIFRMQLFKHISTFNSPSGAQLDPQPALDLAVARALIRKLPVRNDSEIRFKSAVRHISTPAPSVPESALNSANLAAALPFPFHVSVSAVLSHLVFIRIICDIEIDSGVTVTSGRGRVLLQRGSSFCVIDPVSFDALPPPPDKFSSFSSYVSKDSYPCFLRVQSNDLSMFSYSLEAVRLSVLNGPLPFIFHPFCMKAGDSSTDATWIRQSIENPFFNSGVKQWAEFNSVGDRLLNLHFQRCSFFLSSLPNDTSRRFVSALKTSMGDRFFCNVWDPHNSTPQLASALAEARHFIIALTPEYLASGACVTELLHILDLVNPSPDDPRAPVAAHARAIASNPALRKTISLLLLHPAVSSARISSIAQSRLVVVPAAVGVADVVRVSDAANAALMRLVSLARERPDAFKKFDWFTPAINPTFTGAPAPSLDAMCTLVRSLFAASPPQHACLPVDDIANLLSSSSAFIPTPSSDATHQPGGFTQLFAESCSVLDAVTVATLALLGLTDREICDAADSGGKGATDLLGNIAEPKQAEASEFVRKIVAASGVDLLAAKAAAAAAKLPPTPPESADSMRERRESNISNTSDGSNQDSLFSSDGFRSSEGGRSSPVNHSSFVIRPIDSSAAGAHASASAIAPPPAPATQVRGCAARADALVGVVRVTPA